MPYFCLECAAKSDTPIITCQVCKTTINNLIAPPTNSLNSIISSSNNPNSTITSNDSDYHEIIESLASLINVPAAYHKRVLSKTGREE